MAQMLTGSVCFTDLREALKQSHSSGSKAANGKIYANIVIWINDEPDKFGNTVSIQLNSTKEKREEEGKIKDGYLHTPILFDLTACKLCLWGNGREANDRATHGTKCSQTGQLLLFTSRQKKNKREIRTSV